MDRLREMEVFVAVAAEGGLSRVARTLGLSPPAVTRALAALESRIDTWLFHRTTRSLSLTDAGIRFLANAQRLLADIEHAENDASGAGVMPRGHLTVTASAMFGRTVLMPIIAGFLDVHPLVTVTVLMVDRIVDMVQEGVDLAIRISHLPDSSLVARRVGAVRRLLVASPDYLARRGSPAVPADLRDHAVIAVTGLMPAGAWHHVSAGRPRSIALAPRLTVNDTASALSSAAAGYGITVALSYMVTKALRRGDLVPVLGAFAPPEVPVHLVMASGHHVAPAVRAFIEFAVPSITAALGDCTMAAKADEI